MEHQTLYHGDCLDWMRRWSDECADLIYLDPPFNSSAGYDIRFRGRNRQDLSGKGLQRYVEMGRVGGRPV